MNKLYIKIAVLIIGVFVIIGVANTLITRHFSHQNFESINQKLNRNVADQVIQETSPFVNGKLNEEALHHIMHHMMAVNRSIEVYILSPEGNILSYVAPHKKIKLEKVNLAPVEAFIASDGSEYIKGDDPRNPNTKKIFSAAKIQENEALLGYVYIVLLSEEFEAVSKDLVMDHWGKLGSGILALILGSAMLISIWLAWAVTKYLRTIIKSVEAFKNGNLYERIPIKKEGELSKLAESFNEMADTMLSNIERIKAIENLRRELIANVSHDIRTPISITKGYVETILMKDSISIEDRKRYLNKALESTEKLQNLVEELFELSKLEASEIQPNLSTVPITDLVEDVSNRYQLLAQEKGITLKPLYNNDLPNVNVDTEMMERVLQNLLDNAFKFTPSGGIITIEAEAKGKTVALKVSDNGEGIAADDAKHIFERYRKSDKSHNEKGSGLGLAIVKKLLELHSSTIQLSSQPGKGSTFFFELNTAL